MKPDAKIFDDISRMAGGAINVFSSLREQILTDIKVRFDEMATRMDLVPREDLERLEAQVQKLQQRLDELSRADGKAAPKQAAAKPAAKKSPARKPAKKAKKA